ncbi:MAG: VOC family protein [Pseudomonadota bacterium]
MAKVTAINHIAFAVKDLKPALDNAIAVLGGEMMMEFESVQDKYQGACVRFGSSIMSFISSDDPDSFISQYVAKHGNGIQHIGLEIDDIEEYVAELEGKGVKLDKTEMADEDYQEALVGPKAGNGVVLQLTGWKAGPFDATYDGCERLCQKYSQNPKLNLLAGNQLPRD